jgi:integrase
MLTEYLGQPLSGGTGGPDDLIFPSSNGLPMRHTLWYRRVFKPEVRRSLPPAKHGLRFHDLRHTCATPAPACSSPRNAHPKVIADRLGHADIRITMNRYGHLLPAVDAAIVLRPRRNALGRECTVGESHSGARRGLAMRLRQARPGSS